MHKSILFSLLVLLTTVGALSAQNHITHFEEAVEQSETQNKPILMVFSGSDWCKPCILLKREVLTTESFQQFQEKNLVMLELDFPSRKKNELSPEQKSHNEALAERFNPEGAFPMVILLDENQTVVQRITYKMNMQAETFIAEIQASL